MIELALDITEKLDNILDGLPALLPEFVLVAAFIASIASGLFIDRFWRHATFSITLAGIFLSGLSSLPQLDGSIAEGLFFGMVKVDSFGRSLTILIAAVCALFAAFAQASPDFKAHRKKT